MSNLAMSNLAISNLATIHAPASSRLAEGTRAPKAPVRRHRC